MLLTGAAVVVNQAMPEGRPEVVKATVEDFVDALASLTFPLVGALLVSRTGNRLGWIFGAVGLAMATSTLAAATAHYRLATDQLAGVAILQLLQEGLFGVFIGLILMVIPLLFPDGRLRSSRWRPALWAAVGWQGLALLVLFLTPGPVQDETPAVVNPFGADALGSALSVGGGVVSILLVVLPLVGLASLIFGLVRPREGSRLSIVLLLAGIAVSLFAFSLDNVLQPIVPGWGPVAPLLAIPAVPLATYLGLIRSRQPRVERAVVL